MLVQPGRRRSLVELGVCWVAILLVDIIALGVLAPRVSIRPYEVVLIVVGVLILVATLAWDRRLLPLFRSRWWVVAVLVGSYLLAVVARVATSTAPWWAWGLRAGFLLVGIAAVEEVIFRGAIWRRLEDLLPTTLAVLAVDSVLFWLLHVPAWVANGFDVVTACFQLLWGIVFGALRWVTRGLAVPVWAHAMVDLLGT